MPADFAVPAILLVLLAVVRTGQSTMFRSDYLPIGDVRTDPVISQECLSDHVHTFYGPPHLHPTVTYEQLIDTPPAQHSGNLEENKSLYWHPTVYHYSPSTDTYTKVPMDHSTVYYKWAPGEFNYKAFPPGFRMIGGYSPVQAQSVAECVEHVGGCEGDCCAAGECERHPDAPAFFPTQQCWELEVEMSFPSCWDGVSLDSENHASHVAYTADGDPLGECPDSHPVRIPQLSFFFRVYNYQGGNGGGYYLFSDGSGTFHADYIAGWDEQLLQNVLDNCDREENFGGEDLGEPSFCEDFLTYKDVDMMYDVDRLVDGIRAVQPREKADTMAISREEVGVVQGSLPRGMCQGTLLPPTSPAPETTELGRGEEESLVQDSHAGLAKTWPIGWLCSAVVAVAASLYMSPP